MPRSAFSIMLINTEHAAEIVRTSWTLRILFIFDDGYARRCSFPDETGFNPVFQITIKTKSNMFSLAYQPMMVQGMWDATESNIIIDRYVYILLAYT